MKGQSTLYCLRGLPSSSICKRVRSRCPGFRYPGPLPHAHIRGTSATHFARYFVSAAINSTHCWHILTQGQIYNHAAASLKTLQAPSGSSLHPLTYLHLLPEPPPASPPRSSSTMTNPAAPACDASHLCMRCPLLLHTLLPLCTYRDLTSL